jgi:hypothetical protein
MNQPITCTCPCHDGYEPMCNCCARKGETRPVDPAVLANNAALTHPDERSRFESAFAGSLTPQDPDGGYLPNYHLNAAWEGWLARSQSAPAVQGEAADMPASFAEYVAREIPPGTVISNPAWWATRLWRAACTGLTTPQPSAPGVEAADERTRFEWWAMGETMDVSRGPNTYKFPSTRFSWAAWQARARVGAAQPSADNAPVTPRFFHDHGVVHDRVTYKHVCLPSADNTIDEVCELLNGLAAAQPSADDAPRKPFVWCTDWGGERRYAAEPGPINEDCRILNDPGLIRDVWFPLYTAPPADARDAGNVSIELTGAEILEAARFVIPDWVRPADATDDMTDQLETSATIARNPPTAPPGLWIWLSEYPDEGAQRLDDEAGRALGGE